MIKTCDCGKQYDAGFDIAPIPVCPACAEAWDKKIEEQEKLVYSEEAVDENAALDKLGIRPRHYHCTFENFIPRNQEEELSKKTCEKVASSVRGIVALIGNNGTGKTHLACAIARQIGYGRIYKMIEIGMYIRRAFNSNGLISEQEQLDNLIKLPFLGIDETDKSKRTESEINWLSYLIDERNERYRPTVIIANGHSRAIHKDGSSCEKCFESIMTPDILDRMSQYGVIRYFTGESHRRDLRGKD